MLDKLRIKCPSCGTMLEVSNSRHEAVKQITCPMCQRTLAVNFRTDASDPSETTAQDVDLPCLYYGQMRIPLRDGANSIELRDFSNVEFFVAHLSGGGVKCILRLLAADTPLTLNGQTVAADDQIVLTIGDMLEAGTTLLVFGLPSSEPPTPQATQPSSRHEEPSQQTAIPQQAEKPHRSIGMAALIAVAFALCVVLGFLLTRTYYQPNTVASQASGSSDTTLTAESAQRSATLDTSRTSTSIPAKRKLRDRSASSSEQPAAPSDGSSTSDDFPAEVAPSDYDLEQQAIHGDLAAQCELGKRWVRRGDSTNVVKGIQYLRLASEGGNAEATSTLRNVFDRLAQRASQGSTTAANILNEQNRP